MDSICDYIDKYNIKIPDYVQLSHKSIKKSLDDNDINLVKSIIAYRNYIKRMNKDLDILEDYLDSDNN
tara:strand:- start:392 stop:595 length:204 start_codon:yes stop_codon:yes gene_type:complete